MVTELPAAVVERVAVAWFQDAAKSRQFHSLTCAAGGGSHEWLRYDAEHGLVCPTCGWQQGHIPDFVLRNVPSLRAALAEFLAIIEERGLRIVAVNVELPPCPKWSGGDHCFVADEEVGMACSSCGLIYPEYLSAIEKAQNRPLAELLEDRRDGD